MTSDTDKPKAAAGARGGRLRVAVLLGVLLGLVTAPFWFIALLFWAAEGSWDFDDRAPVRYWLFVKGSRLERLGFVLPTGEPPRYSISLQEGTFPGWSVLQYASAATPADVIAAYAERCRAMRLEITQIEPASPASAGDTAEASLTCQIELYLDAEFFAERKAAAPTRVSLRVWGMH